MEETEVEPEGIIEVEKTEVGEEERKKIAVKIEKEETTTEDQGTETKDRERAKEETDVKVPFVFNIEDNGFTELSFLWKKEEMAAKGRESEIWNRRYKNNYYIILNHCLQHSLVAST